MLTYFAGFIVIGFVWTLIFVCWFEGTSSKLVKYKPQQASTKSATEYDEHGPPKSNPALTAKVEAGVNSTTRQDGRDESNEEVATYRRWGNIAERIVALAAVLAIIVYIAQALFMWNANTHAQTEQRAWISISEPAWYDDPLKLGYAPRGTIRVTNLGLTPARISRHFMRAWPMLKWHGFPRSLDMPLDLTPVQTIVPPKEERELSVFYLHNLMEEDIKLGMMVQFVVVYLDAFGNERVTVACYVYTPGATEKFKWSAFGLDDCDRMD